MVNAPRYLSFCLLLLTASGFNSVQADTVVDARMSGAWFDPGHSGEGFVLEVLDGGTAAVYWFTYEEDGRQRWLIGSGSVENDTVSFDTLLHTSGAVFGDSFEPGDVEYTEVGELSIRWSGCSAATATYTVDGTAGSQALTRLTTLAGLDCETPASIPSPVSGSWYDQTHVGEGLVIEALDDGRVVVFWFTYDGQGEQAWFHGLGEQDGASILIPDMFITSGGRFGPDFDPLQVEQQSWGGLLVELDCDFGKFDYASQWPAFGSGKQTLTRLTSPGNPACEASEPPNILLIIADDLGLDALSQYDISDQQAVTPSLDQLAEAGLVFDNAWSNPTCSPTRAGILTGKYGARTGVLAPSDVLSEDETSLQSYIHQHLPGRYADAVIGKWHLGPQPGGQDHPSKLGIGYFAGIIGGAVEDYEDWRLSINGQAENETEYATSKLVDLAIEWTGAQERPWFLWLAFNAPHTPFHLPPAHLHNRDLPGTETDIDANPLPYYFAAIEAMDTEVGRLLGSLDVDERANTVAIFIGDNGTPGRVAQYPYSRDKAKGSLYQGGINVPLFVSGPGVERTGERESALVNTTDLFGTIAALAGVNVDEVQDSVSFERLLKEEREPDRFFQYSDQSAGSGEEWSISDGIYKLIETSSGTHELYQLSTDPFEETDLVENGAAPAGVVDDLRFLANRIRQGPAAAKDFTIVGTNQQQCYDGQGANIACPDRTEAFHGQDAQHPGNPPDFEDSGDGTVADNITGLTWQQSADTNQDGRIDAGDKLTFSQAQSYCDELELAGHTDWRLPGIKQLYSLIDFSGTDPSGYEGSDTSGLLPFIDDSVFGFGYGDTNAGERIIDAQYASSTLYVSNTGNDGGQTLFGVNFADGRIKGYGLSLMGQDKTFYVMCVRGNDMYGQNDFTDNGDGTVTDAATGLMWAQEDSITGLDWEQALAWVEQLNTTSHLGYSDWRLPDAKELQSLVDYSRSPAASGSAAIDHLFVATAITNEAGASDFPSYWTSTTHVNWTANPGSAGVYIAFGRAMGYMNGSWIDVHGAGAQRSDPKLGDPADYPTGRGPQGDAIRIYNHVRLVRDAR